MQNTYSIKPIAYIRNDFPDKVRHSPQSSLINTLKAEIVFEPEYRNPEAFRGLEDYSHIWADLGILRKYEKQLDCYRPPTPSRRQYPHGRFCNPLSFSPKSPWAFFCSAGKHRTPFRAWTDTPYSGGRFNERHADF